MSAFNPEQQKLLEEGHEGLLPAGNGFEDALEEVVPSPESERTDTSDALGKTAVDEAGVELPEPVPSAVDR